MSLYILIWNLIVFLIYGIDKIKAIRGSFRISESVLITCAFAMGGFGAIFGMYVFRHKTRKLKFRLLVPVALVLNIALIYYLNKK